MEENAACYEILQQALPHIPDEGEESSKGEATPINCCYSNVTC